MLNLNYYTQLEPIVNEYTCLIAGTIGSGKSVLLDDLIYNITARDLADTYIGIIDLKRVQYNKWVGLPQLKDLGIAKDMQSAIALIDRITRIMDYRYEELEKTGAVKWYGQRVYLIIDELADLLTNKEVEKKLTHLMRLCRAANISVFMATQSPTRKVITANIQNCVTSAMGLRCRSSIESRQIIGMTGCEDLPKYGWGIFFNSDGYVKIQIGMTPDELIAERVADWNREMVECKKGNGKTQYTTTYNVTNKRSIFDIKGRLADALEKVIDKLR